MAGPFPRPLKENLGPGRAAIYTEYISTKPVPFLTVLFMVQSVSL